MISNSVSEKYKVINMQGWSNGVYIYHFETLRERISVKFIKK